MCSCRFRRQGSEGSGEFRCGLLPCNIDRSSHVIALIAGITVNIVHMGKTTAQKGAHVVKDGKRHKDVMLLLGIPPKLILLPQHNPSSISIHAAPKIFDERLVRPTVHAAFTLQQAFLSQHRCCVSRKKIRKKTRYWSVVRLNH